LEGGGGVSTNAKVENAGLASSKTGSVETIVKKELLPGEGNAGAYGELKKLSVRDGLNLGKAAAARAVVEKGRRAVVNGSAKSQVSVADKPPRADMGDYKDTKGHHVHAKKAFEGHPKYDPKKGFSISNEFMAKKGWDHHRVTTAQRQLYGELSKTGRPNTLKEHTRIAVESLKRGGATEQEARDIVSQGLQQLRKDKVLEPTGIPWYNKK
jgi:hypothetical protein